MKAHAHLTVSQAKAQAELLNAHTRAKELEVTQQDSQQRNATELQNNKDDQKLEALRLAKEVMEKHVDHAHERAEADKDRVIDIVKTQASAEQAKAKLKKGKKDGE